MSYAIYKHPNTFYIRIISRISCTLQLNFIREIIILLPNKQVESSTSSPTLQAQYHFPAGCHLQTMFAGQ